MFQPIQPPESTVDRCANVLRQAILSRRIGPGERLPPERELAESLGVSRLTVRAALFQLRTAGLLEVRQGSGYTVCDFERAGGTDLLVGLAALAAEDGNLAALAEELFEVRRALARIVLERIAHQRRPMMLAGIRAAVERLADAMARDPRDTAALSAADVDVLRELLAASAGPVLRLCINPVASVLATLGDLREAIYAKPHENLAAYRALLRWLEDPDPAGIDAILGALCAQDAAALVRLRQQQAQS